MYTHLGFYFVCSYAGECELKCSFILGKVHSLRKRDFADVIKDFEIRSSWINWMALKSKESALIRTADTVKEAM